VERILDEHRGQTILVVTHGRLLRVLLSTLLDFGLERMNEINHANTGVNIVTHLDGRFDFTLLNCTAHLDNVCPVLLE
jgi:broad specificity phosphatase PhoE